MTTTNSTTLRRHRLAAIATGGLVTALALARVGAPRAVLVDKRGFTTIDPPGAIQATASDINDRGQIIGFFRVPGDVQ
jgi:hypothetical protein